MLFIFLDIETNFLTTNYICVTDYQVVFPDSITDQVITVTTEQTTNISNELLVVEGKKEII